MKINLAEELLLLAYDDAGSLTISGQWVDYGLTGALLMELILAGRLSVENKRVVVIDGRITGDPVVDEALARIRMEPRKPQDWVNRLGKGLRDRLLHRMVEAGVLRHEQDRVLWVFPTLPRSQVREHLKVIADGNWPADAVRKAIEAVEASVAATVAITAATSS